MYEYHLLTFLLWNMLSLSSMLVTLQFQLVEYTLLATYFLEPTQIMYGIYSDGNFIKTTKFRLRSCHFNLKENNTFYKLYFHSNYVNLDEFCHL